MTYAVKEIIYTLQGEGAHVGRPAVFCRFSGCNLWSGREQDRATSVCTFCDTDFVGTDGQGGGRYGTPSALAEAVQAKWPLASRTSTRPFAVCTGGEPLLQLDRDLVAAFRSRGFEVAVETNGTLSLPCELDWVCVSPKAGTELALRCGDELKLVFPQDGLAPSQFEAMNFRHFFLQPRDGKEIASNTELAVRYCLANPKWRLSLQIHKVLQIA